MFGLAKFLKEAMHPSVSEISSIRVTGCVIGLCACLFKSFRVALLRVK